MEHWTSPVRFRETIEALHDDGARVFLEAGPRGNMTAFVEDILRGRGSAPSRPTTAAAPGVTQLNHLAGMLAVHDVALDVGYLFEHRGHRGGRLARPGAAVAGDRRADHPAVDTLADDLAVERRDGPARRGARRRRRRSPAPVRRGRRRSPAPVALSEPLSLTRRDRRRPPAGRPAPTRSTR